MGFFKFRKNGRMQKGGETMAISGVRIENGYQNIPVAQPTSTVEAGNAFLEKMQAAYGKAENGGTDDSFQIGGKSYTQDEWDKMLAKVDRQIDRIREQNREDTEAREALAEARAAGTHTETEITEDQIAELFRDRG